MTKTLLYLCTRCGLRYKEQGPVTSPWFALCPRCSQFNEPKVQS